MRRLFCVASMAGCLLAADATVEGPTLGYVNSAAGVRSVLGLVGSARLSAPVTGELQGAAILPGSASAIARNPAGALVRINLKDGSVTSLGYENVIDFAVSPGGTSVLARDAGSLHVVSASSDVRWVHSSPGAARRMAVSDDGVAVLLSLAESEGEAVYVMNQDGLRRVFRASGIAALAFLPGSRDAVFADTSGEIYRLKSNLELLRLGDLQHVKALAGTSDGRVIAVAGHTIAALALDASPATSVECPCEGAIAQPLGGSRFLVSAGDDGPMWLVDASGTELRVAFIPEAVND